MVGDTRNVHKVQALLRTALCEWHSWLSLQARDAETWRAIPHWCKSVPSKLDREWLLYDLEHFVDNKSVMTRLCEMADFLMTASKDIETAPDSRILYESVMELVGEEPRH